MPTIEYLVTPVVYAGSPPHWGPPWAVSGFKVTSRYYPGSLQESSDSDVDSIGSYSQSWVSVRLSGAVSAYTALTTGDKSQVSVSPPTAPYDDPPIERSIFITFPGSDSWNGAIVSAIQYAEGPEEDIGVRWIAGGAAAMAVPGVMSRNFRTLRLTALGSYSFPITNFEWEFNGDSVLQGVNPYPFSGYYYGLPLSREFGNYAVINGPVRVRAIGANSVISAWTSVKFQPCANGVVQQLDNEILEVNGKDSFDPDGQVVEWIWEIGTNFTVGPTTVALTEPNGTIPVSSIPGPWRDNLTVDCRLRVRDNEGLLSAPIPLSFTYYEVPSPMGLVDDATGTVYASMNVDDTVEVVRFTEGLSSREVLHVIANAKNPAYTIHPLTGQHYVSYENRETKEQEIVSSVAGGQSWQ